MSITGPDFISLQVRDLERAADFYESVVGLTRAAASPPHAVVFDTTPIAFAVRDLVAGVESDPAVAGRGVAVWFHDPEGVALHASLVAAGVTIVQQPIEGPFGFTFTFADLDAYAVTVHDRQAPA
jgi:predicted enzyme related to lactoylglutathione lyase